MFFAVNSGFVVVRGGFTPIQKVLLIIFYFI
jgi:hypothetical protein